MVLLTIRLIIVFRITRLTLRLLHCKKFLNLAYVCTMYKCKVVEVTFLLLSLLCQDVTVISVLSLDFTCSGKSESFF